MSTFYNYFQCRLAFCPQEASFTQKEKLSLTENMTRDFYRELYKRTFPLKEGEEVTDITQLEELLANALDSYNLFCQLGRKWDTIVGNLSQALASYLEDTHHLPEETRLGVMRTVADLQKLMIDLCRYKVAIVDNNRFYQALLVELKELKRKETERLKEL